MCIVKLRFLKAVLDTKFAVIGRCDVIESHPTIPIDGASPF